MKIYLVIKPPKGGIPAKLSKLRLIKKHLKLSPTKKFMEEDISSKLKDLPKYLKNIKTPK
tara:strand:- start:697 stop:876 length:180 start_codon:yes stop_codon:yes gene_type:complete